ncbi:hypothetical protein GCM10020255_036390 [Rhodococcus baikonurensis]
MAHVYNSGVEIPMRDGVTLAALVFQPLEGNAPTLLLRTPYGLASHGAGPTEVLPFVDAGYAVVWVESRGTFKSEGNFGPKRTNRRTATTPWNGSSRNRGRTDRSAPMGRRIAE